MSENRQGTHPDRFCADWGIILGSGLGDCGASWPLLQTFTFEQVGLQKPTVPGHEGLLEWRRGPDNRVVLFCRGRLHSYEGHSLPAVCQMVEFFAANRIQRCLLTCAAGGIRKDLTPGDFVLAREILLAHYPGSWPQFAAHLEAGTKITSSGSDLRFTRFATKLTDATELKCGLHAQMTGPSYETPAEVRMLSQLGVWTVGMSSGVELTRSRELGLVTGAIAVVANPACGLGLNAISHEDVLKTMRNAARKLERLIHHLVLETRSFQVDQ